MTLRGGTVLPNWHNAWGKAEELGLGLRHSYSYGYRLASGTYGPIKAKAGAQLQVSIWDMEQGQNWGTVTG